MSPTESVCAKAQALWGDDWPRPASDALRVNVRTLQRIWSAGRDGLEYEAAGGVLRAIEELLIEVSAICGRGKPVGGRSMLEVR